MIELLKTAKTALETIEGINTVAIGIEPHLSPKDYPIIRIVPIESRQDKSIAEYKNVTMDIYIGIADKTDKDGYEAIYEALEAWEREVITRLNEAGAYFWKSTKQDEDRLHNVKVIALRFEVVG